MALAQGRQKLADHVSANFIFVVRGDMHILITHWPVFTRNRV
jgi:hypothetical protein